MILLSVLNCFFQCLFIYFTDSRFIHAYLAEQNKVSQIEAVTLQSATINVVR